MSGPSLTIGKWKGTAFRLHWSLPFGLAILSGFQFVPVFWVGFAALVLLHEVGHMLVVRAVGGRSTEVMLTGWGGHCAWYGEVSVLSRAAIACGGVAAQLVLLLGVLTALHFELFDLEDSLVQQAVYLATFRNAWLIAFNLIPVAPLDGAEAWLFPIELGKRVRRSLTTWRDVSKVGADVDFSDAQPSTDTERAKSIAAQLLAEARKDEGEPE